MRYTSSMRYCLVILVLVTVWSCSYSQPWQPSVRQESPNTTVIISSFAEGARKITHFKFGNDSRIKLDSLLPLIKGSIPSVIQNFRRLVSDSSDLNLPWYKNIYSRIVTLSTTPPTRISQAHRLELSKMIHSLPPSRQKISLLFEYSWLTITIENFDVDVEYYLQVGKKEADQITDSLDKGIAYHYIGNFASHHRYADVAIPAYFRAIELINHSDKSDSIRSYYTGINFQGLAQCFSQLDLPLARLKTIFYDSIAANSFKESKRWDLYQNVFFLCLQQKVYSFYLDFPWSTYENTDTLVATIKTTTEILDSLKAWELQPAYYVYSALSTILEVRGETQAALFFQLRAVLGARYRNNAYDLIYSLTNTSRLYSKLGNEQLSMEYIDLAATICQRLNLPADYYFSLLQKGSNYLELKKHEAALSIAERVEKDSAMQRILYPTFYTDVRSALFALKARIYANHDWQLYWDSVSYNTLKYQNLSNDYTMNRLDNFSELLSVEYESATQYYRREVTKSFLSLENEKKKVERAKNELERANIQLQYTNFKLTYAYRMISNQKDSIQNQKDTMQNRATRKAKEDSEINRKLTEFNYSLQLKTDQLKIANHKLTKIQKYLTGALTTAGLVVLILAWTLSRTYKQKKILNSQSTKLDQQTKVLDRQNLLLNLLTHDIRTIVCGVPSTLRRKLRSISHTEARAVIQYSEDVSDYLTNIYDIDTNISTFENELNNSEKYIEIFRITKLDRDINIAIAKQITDDILSLPFPKFLLNNFVKNSLEHGLSSNHNDFIIKLSGEKTSTGYRITIEDFGVGINNSRNSGSSTGHGLALTNRMIKVFNEESTQYKIVLPENFIIDKSDLKAGTTGTLITFYIIKT
jgi:hypothetical protein